MNNTSNSSEIQKKKIYIFRRNPNSNPSPRPTSPIPLALGRLPLNSHTYNPLFEKNPGSAPGYEQQRHGTATSRSLTSNTVTERLADRDWCTKSQSSLLNINFRLSGFQSSLLLVYFRYGLNTCSHYTKV